MVKRNENIAKVSPNYLFPEVYQRKRAFQEQNPQARIISLGVGDTTEPLPKVIAHALAEEAERLGTREGYTGYGPSQGYELLRQQISAKLYQNRIKADDIFISDGSKCDIGRLQLLFGSRVTAAIQDPAYPVYVDGSIMQGSKQMIFLPCSPENQFFPDLERAKGVDLLYFCSPNNPTGIAATRSQLEQLVAFARQNHSIILYDAAYAAYIDDPQIPKSIFEIEGAQEVAIELGSFSKIAGFTGVRLGWSVVTEELQFEDGFSVKKDWLRVISTVFNGASNISQSGGIGVLSDEGMKGAQAMVAFYRENVRQLKEACEQRGWEVYGGKHAPYLWVRFKGRNSWDIFQEFLEKRHLVTTPGSGFGPSGESFVRMTAFGSSADIEEAKKRIASRS
jgi:LL-diaminopimelate aminotransferase